MAGFTLSGLLDVLAAHPGFRALTADLARAEAGRAVGPLGLPEPARPVVVSALARAARVPILWLTAQANDARVLADALRAYLPDPERVRLLPAPDALPFERIPWDPVSREARMAALAALYRWTAIDASRAPVVVAPVRGAMTRTLARASFGADAARLRTGDVCPVTPFLARLQRLGYETVHTVTQAGQVAHRGGIVDVFPPASHDPVRIEWFGDEIDSLRPFDVTSQRSGGALDEVFIVPAAEALPGAGPALAPVLAALELTRLHPLAESEFRRQREHLLRGEIFPGLEFYTALLHPEHVTVVDHLPPEAWIVYDDLDALSAVAHEVAQQAQTVREEQVVSGELPANWPGQPLTPWADVLARLADFRQLALGQLGAPIPAPGALGPEFGVPPRYGGRIEEAVLEVAGMAQGGRPVVVVSRQAPRFAELLGDTGLALAPAVGLPQAPGPNGVAVVHGALAEGWTLGGPAGVVVLTDHELFGWRMPHRRRATRPANANRAADYFAELTIGDYVVHMEHGIGVFRGLQRMRVGNTERDYLCLEYAQGDKLFVPTHQTDRVARYVGGASAPTVHRLGTVDWERATARARREVEDIARELLELYARRELARRQTFAADTPWQAEMEAAFPYIETEDQLRAIDQVKRDMESERPMDRLVVGDVGFGKTEVALRAAFKAVMDGRQVAVLAPTTVLAQQHLDTFRQRLTAFPVRVEMLSRFRSRADQSRVIERLAAGDVDIVVGTHRLLSNDVRFKNLGLLIVDEEHRFGVKDKERLRRLRQDVDTLTLTATPIPRTMHMALSGLRDLTTIDTPPEERLPVVTHVGPWDENLVRQAIRREVGRRGQVFYVSHKVLGIELLADKIQRLVPEARVGIAHGQLREDQLAAAMLDFVADRVDVLVCTSIIESGLDIPNANTLVIERADRFGLAQLHQLRGRVGRGPQRAYAYFLHPTGFDLPADARERLEALADASDLGAGLRIAMRDLEIRGAGEILGARQHGQVAAIGLDLYTRLLAEAIKKLRADTPTPGDGDSTDLADLDPGALPAVDLPLDAFLPEDYVAETNERTRLYQRMAKADTTAAVDEIEHELVDRFGRAPLEVANLLMVLRLRVLAHRAAAQSVGREDGTVVIRWGAEHPLDREALKAALEPGARIGRHQVSLVVSGPPDSWLPRLERALAAAAAVEGGRGRRSRRRAAARPGDGAAGSA
jgi:transcription-repair coupling factor (superfamily II helicase)